MPNQYYTILTTLGLAENAASQSNGTAVSLTHMALGDGNGNEYNPVEGQTALVNEVYRAALNSISVDPDNPNWIIAELVVPATEGGWYIREAGIISSTGNLYAIAKLPATYKPLFSEGAGKDLVIRMIMEVTNADSVSLQVDPSVVLASQQYVNDEIDALKHEARRFAFFFGGR